MRHLSNQMTMIFLSSQRMLKLEVGVVEEQDPLEAALERAEIAEKKSLTKMLKYKIFVSVSEREKSDLIQYGSMGLREKCFQSLLMLIVL